jgi:acetyl-CoA carboxylase carboxyltransferase component
MGAKGAVEILHRRELLAIDDEERQAKRRRELESEYEAVHLSPTVAAQRGFIDEVIEPVDTRKVVAGALAALSAKRERLRARRHENIPL